MLKLKKLCLKLFLSNNENKVKCLNKNFDINKELKYITFYQYFQKVYLFFSENSNKEQK